MDFLQLELCRQHEGLVAYYQKFAYGEAVVWLMIPIIKLGLGNECMSAWGLKPRGYIVVSFTIDLCVLADAMADSR